jgi:cytochrome P450 family 6
MPHLASSAVVSFNKMMLFDVSKTIDIFAGLEDPNSEFMKNGRRLFDLTTFELIRFFFSVDYPDLARKLGFRFNPKEVADFFYNTFIQTFEYRAKNNVQRNDFVSMLLELKDQFTPLELAAESMLVFAAGYETSSTLMTFTLYSLATNPDIQNKLRDEITSAIEENDGKLTYEMLFGFKYLDMVMSETLRMYPPIADNMRKCNSDYTIPGTNLVIPKDTTVEINTYSLHHDPEYFPEPQKFIPERFSDENVKNIKPFTYLPFGEGARICLGMRFGLMQSKMGIAKLIKDFSFSPCEKTPIPMKFVASFPFLAPVGGMWLKIEKI